LIDKLYEGSAKILSLLFAIAFMQNRCRARAGQFGGAGEINAGYRAMDFRYGI